MPFLLLIFFSVVIFWLLIRFNQFGKRLPPLAVFKQMERKPKSVINPNPPVVIKPTPEIITVRPIQRQAIVVKPVAAVVIEPKAIDIVRVQPVSAITVMPPERGAWDERGWTRTLSGGHETYEGYFAVGGRRFHGRIENRNRGRDLAVYIYDPPREIKRHRHGACFQLVGDGWFHLHWARPARNIDDAILYMERVLDESLNG